MKKYFCRILVSFFLIIPNLVLSANHYVRAGASGRNDGSDWANAWTSLPSNLIRGDTCYIADGNYPGYTFDDPESGSTYIYLKKAIASDHGTNTGWNSSYGDGQAEFGPFTFTKGYYVIDGQIGGGPKSWTKGFGFKIKGTAAGQILIRMGGGTTIASGVSNIIVMHTELEHRGRNTGTSDDGIYGFYARNITVSHCYLHDFGRAPILMRGWNNVIFEYSYIARNTYTAAQHSEGISDSGSDNVIIRHNIWNEIQGTGVIVCLENIGVAANWEIYGNVFLRAAVAGLIRILNDANSNASAQNWKIYNNTMVEVAGLWSGFIIEGGSNNVAYNNLWYNCIRTAHRGAITISHSWYYNTQRDGDDNAVQIGTGDPFVNVANENFHLKASTQNGKGALGSPYNEDADGNFRGSDGVWDRGAYEYGSVSGFKPPDPPQNLRITVVP